MQIALLDWLIIAAYVAFALAVGLRFARRASSSPDEFFVSGRSLPWWLAGTSMVATTFAVDTPLVITGWVRDYGIWKNWLWWCFAVGSLLSVFVFARLWRRTGALTKAELAELRYGGAGARALRASLGFLHAGVTNTIVLCWVLLAAAKIADVMFQIDKAWALAIGCAIALSYSLLAGFWGVVVTDLVQFIMAMVGSVALAFISWRAIDGLGGLVASGALGPDTLRFLPSPGPGALWEVSFWTTPVAILAVNLGVGWWATEWVDGDTVVVQRVLASRDERQGSLAVLWYAVAHYGLRPWPWILVALASLVILPTLQVQSPVDGVVRSVDERRVVIEPAGGGSPVEVSLRQAGSAEDWYPLPAADLTPGQAVSRGQQVARTDSERAYVVMLTRYLPAGLLGLVVASLLAAFMSTIDTHVNLASSFFVNDLYRRFVRPRAAETHYVFVARLAGLGVMAMAALFAYAAESISDLFTFLLAFVGGVGPVYVLRWLWWRVRASTEIVAMAASAVTTVVVSNLDLAWQFGPLSPDGSLLHEARLLIVVAVSILAALGSMWLTPGPDPRSLVPFYEKVRPVGWWAPVRSLAAPTEAGSSSFRSVLGVISGLALIYGALFGLGHLLLGGRATAAMCATVSVLGAAGVLFALRPFLAGKTPS